MSCLMRSENMDAFPFCLDTKDMEEIIRTVKLIASGFGGINLEDIYAPRCFEIEYSWEKLDIPVFSRWPARDGDSGVRGSHQYFQTGWER